MLAITLKTVSKTKRMFCVIKNKNKKQRILLIKVIIMNSLITFFSKYNSLGALPATETAPDFSLIFVA